VRPIGGSTAQIAAARRPKRRSGFWLGVIFALAAVVGIRYAKNWAEQRGVVGALGLGGGDAHEKAPPPGSTASAPITQAPPAPAPKAKAPAAKTSAPPAPPKVETAVLRITSAPAGAIVRTRARVLGRTPINLHFKTGNTYELKLVKSGYTPATRRVAVNNAKT